MVMNAPEKGDLVLLNFTPQSGREHAGYRPAIVISPKKFNEVVNLAIVCPITKQKKGYPFEIELPIGLEVDGVILTDHIKSIDWRSRNMKVVGKAPDDVFDKCITRIHTFIDY